MFTIEKNIPIPASIRSAENPFPFDQMETGDSFVIPINKRSLYGRYKVIYKKTNPDKDFFSRVEGENVRVWRTK